jgi:hypothetical protein
MIEIVRENKKRFRVGIVDTEAAFKPRNDLFRSVTFLQLESRVSWRELMPLLEVWPFVPKGAGDNVYLSIAIEISEVHAFSPEFVGGLGFFEGMN